MSDGDRWKWVPRILRAPVTADPDESRALRVSYTLALAVAIAVVPPILLNMGYGSDAPELLLVGEFLTSLVALWLVRKGRWRRANLLIMYSLLVMGIVLALYAPYGLRDTSAFIFPTLIVCSGLILSTRAFLLYAALVTLSVGVLFELEVLGVVRNLMVEVANVRDLVEGVTVCAVGAIATWLLSSDLQESIRSANERGAALEASNASLLREQSRLQLSEERVRTLVEGSPDGILQLDTLGRIESCNPATLQLLGLPTEASALRRNIMEFIGTESHPVALARMGEVVRGRVIRDFELTVRKDNGDPFVCEVSAAPMRGSGKETLSVLVIARDVTERKRAQERLEESFREQQVLLKEVHHRVKNNLQVISSLLSLEANQIGDNQMRDLLLESRSRVRSMSLVHEKLYRSHTLASIDFGDYLEAVVGELIRAYGNSDVSGHVSGRGILLPVDVAIPCGLIVNELVSNALKHAFRGRSGGNIRVMIQRSKVRELELVISDNGEGIPEGRDISKMQSMGMTIVTNLVDQIEGTLEHRRGEGTEFRIRFPEPA